MDWTLREHKAKIKDTVTVKTLLQSVAGLYIVGIGVLFAIGGGAWAAYLTMPSWLMVGSVTLPSPVEEWSYSWLGNLTLLLLSAALNMAVVSGAVLATRWLATRP